MDWISVKKRLPECEKEVLIWCNRNDYRFVCPAIYEDGTMLTQDSTWNWYEIDCYGTYSEDNDDYFFFHDNNRKLYTAKNYSEFKSQIQKYAPYLSY